MENELKIHGAKIIMARIRECLSFMENEVSQQYSYSKIKVDNTEGDLYIWISLRWLEDKKAFVIGIENIQLPISYRRKGYFTELVKYIGESKYCDTLAICNVISVEMFEACKKLNMVYVEELNNFQLKC